MMGVTTRHPEEPYATNARTVLWEVLGATRAPTRLGGSRIDIGPARATQAFCIALQGLSKPILYPGFRRPLPRAPSPWALLPRAALEIGDGVSIDSIVTGH